MLSEKVKKELRELAHSPKLQEDMKILSKNKYSPFLVNGNIDIDKFLLFLNEYNYFINHNPRRFCKIIDKDMRL